MTVTVVLVAPVRTTVRVTLFVFSATLMALVVKATEPASSSVMVMVFVPVPMLVLEALLRRMEKVSFPSCVASSAKVRVTVLVVTPGAKVKVPLAAV